ncbi:hypothetical protein HPC49_28945 [Pyxidicoccus fallax]|uniref:Lipoprotein n=1 Tax=Pyxidicoccus fallax TaxID=394095 RepID=A0A848LEC7_9BACT|nr:hypothetical protein [Pyxidicoccus fallax]NMO16572.1 hypothetical protein [Pyxidicoccus fallax]NPC82232.1 hypothetical protein [Pyxidicoccus fallax]
MTPVPDFSSARAVLTLLLTLFLASPAWAGDESPAASTKTQVKSPKGRQQLLGEHPLTLQWLTFDKTKPGKATVTEEDGVLMLQGEQRAPNGDHLIVEGMVESVDEKTFVLVGRVVTQVNHINDGKACLREGRFTFRITGKRRYWRMKEMDNPCEGVTDYVDVFLR